MCYKSLNKSELIKSEKPESDMSSESGILADHLNEDNLNDENITEDDPKQNSSSPELLLEAIRRIGRDKLRNIMLDLSFGSKSVETGHFGPIPDHFGPNVDHLIRDWPFSDHFYFIRAKNGQ